MNLMNDYIILISFDMSASRYQWTSIKAQLKLIQKYITGSSLQPYLLSSDERWHLLQDETLACLK